MSSSFLIEKLNHNKSLQDMSWSSDRKIYKQYTYTYIKMKKSNVDLLNSPTQVPRKDIPQLSPALNLAR